MGDRFGASKEKGDGVEILFLKLTAFVSYGWFESFVSVCCFIFIISAQIYLTAHIQWVSTAIRRCTETVSTSALQINIFVTNVPDPRPPLLPGAGESSSKLEPPTANFARQGAQPSTTDSSFENISHSQDASYYDQDVTDILDMYGDLGHETHVLDLTNFDGEDDTHLPGEQQLSSRIRKEGKRRREKSRLSMAPMLAMGTQRQTDYASPRSPGVHSALLSGKRLSGSPTGSTFHQKQTSDPLREDIESQPSFQTPMQSQLRFQMDSPSFSRGGETPVSDDGHSTWRGFDPRRMTRFDMDEVEADDTPVVAELARPGRARIDRILADEASMASGSMIVACKLFPAPYTSLVEDSSCPGCGPASLNAVVRKSVAAQIHPSGIREGKTPSITLVSEDFEW